MKKIYLLGTALLSILSTAGAWAQAEITNTSGEPTFTISGEGVTYDEEIGYTLDLGEVVLNEVAKEFTLTASNYSTPIVFEPHIMATWKFAETATSDNRYTFTPDENGNINTTFTIRFKTEAELEEMGMTIEDLISWGAIIYGTPAMEPWGISAGNIINLNILFTPVEESPETDLFDQPEMENISFNGEEIINSLNLDVVVYNAIGQLVAYSNKNINLSAYPAGVYVIKAANGASMKIVK